MPPDIFTGMEAAYTSELNFVTTAFSNGTVSGSITASVFRGTNSFGANNLTFVYQITNNATSSDGIIRGTAFNFTGFQTDVGYTATGSLLVGGHYVNGTALAPSSVDRIQSSGDTVGFNFLNGIIPNIGIRPGQTSFALIIETDGLSLPRELTVSLMAM